VAGDPVGACDEVLLVKKACPATTNRGLLLGMDVIGPQTGNEVLSLTAGSPDTAPSYRPGS